MNISEKKILFIDDDADLAQMYALKFEKEGFQTKVCTDGLTALGLLAEYNPDVIFLDIMMPSINGYETLQAIRNLIISINPIIILFTNLGDPENIRRCNESEADVCLLKANTTPKDAIDNVMQLLQKEEERILSSAKVCPHCHRPL